MTIYIITGYAFGAGYTFGALCIMRTHVRNKFNQFQIRTMSTVCVTLHHKCHADIGAASFNCSSASVKIVKKLRSTL
jgi:hypothetical protein